MSLQSQYAVGLHCDENPTKNRFHHNIICPQYHMLYQLINFCSISKGNEINKGKDKGLWKDNIFRIFNIDFVKQIKKLIEHIKQQQLSESDYSNTKFVNLQLSIQRKSQKKLKNLNVN